MKMNNYVVDTRGAIPLLICGLVVYPLPYLDRDMNYLDSKVHEDGHGHSDSRRQLINKMIASYEHSVQYWTRPERVIASSTRLEQSKEFIESEALRCTEMLKTLRKQ